MRKLLIVLLAGVVAAGLLAGCFSTPKGESGKSCAAPEAKAKCAQAPCCKGGKCMMLKGVKLTDEQKDKVKAIQDKCMAAGCTPDSSKAMQAELKTVLTDEQKAQCDKNCEKMMKKGCCKPKAEAETIDKQVEKKVKKADCDK